MELELTKSYEDTEIDTPPHQTQPISHFSSSFTKNRSHHLRRLPPSAAVTFKECMKNHAANIGGHAVDGCGEFMPPRSGPTSLTCAACGCHRNFHRQEPDSPTAPLSPPFVDFRHRTLPKRFSLSPSPPPRPQSQVLFNFRTGAVAEEHHQAPPTPTAENPSARKRFRTKFSQEQREKMLSFSEKIGWRVQRCDESAVQEFCREIGVNKGVLKVWMHNNKSNASKKEITGGGGGGGGGGNNFLNHGGDAMRNSEEARIGDNDSNFQNDTGNGTHFHSSN